MLFWEKRMLTTFVTNGCPVLSQVTLAPTVTVFALKVKKAFNYILYFLVKPTPVLGQPRGKGL